MISKKTILSWLSAGAFLLISAPAHAGRIQQCLSNETCQFSIFGSLSPEGASMSFWILKTEWQQFTEEDKAELRIRLNNHLFGMHAAPEVYAANKEYGDRLSEASRAFPLAIKNIQDAKGYVVFLCIRNKQGRLQMTEESLKKF